MTSPVNDMMMLQRQVQLWGNYLCMEAWKDMEGFEECVVTVVHFAWRPLLGLLSGNMILCKLLQLISRYVAVGCILPVLPLKWGTMILRTYGGTLDTILHQVRSSLEFKSQWRGALIFSLLCVWINGWVKNRKAGDLRRYRSHYDVTVMYYLWWTTKMICYTCFLSGIQRFQAWQSPAWIHFCPFIVGIDLLHQGVIGLYRHFVVSWIMDGSG